jgi:hypothetical protein
MYSRMKTARPWALAAVLAVLAGCGDGTGPRYSSVVRIDVDSAAGPITRTVTVHLAAPGPVRVTYGATGTPVLALTADSVALAHRFVLPRLRAERTYTVEAQVPGVGEAPRSQAFGTRKLPPELAAIQLYTTGTPSLPVALIEVVGGTEFTGLLMVEDGEIVGYIPVEGALFGMTRRANGDIVVLHPADGLLVQRLDGTLAHRLPQSSDATPYGRIHHDVTATPANTLLFIANEVQAVDGVAVTGEALWEWNPEAGTVVKRWSAFDHLEWSLGQGSRAVAGNWLHGNGISFGPRGNVVMSLRNIDQVISIAPDFSRVEWRLGGVHGTLAIADDDQFLGQHYVSEPAPNQVLVFDNGWERPEGAFSRAIEFRVDVAAGTATRTWHYTPVPNIYASLVGSARRLPNGNSTVLFGMLGGANGSTGPIRAVEVTPAGAEVWSLLVGPQLTRLYRLTPVASLLGESAGAFGGG